MTTVGESTSGRVTGERTRRCWTACAGGTTTLAPASKSVRANEPEQESGLKVEDDQVGDGDCGLNPARETKRGATVCHSQQVPSFSLVFPPAHLLYSSRLPSLVNAPGCCRGAANCVSGRETEAGRVAGRNKTRVESQDRWLGGFVGCGGNRSLSRVKGRRNEGRERERESRL